MALPVAPNLAPARRQLEKLMTDQCIIWTDVASVRDEVVDPLTLKLVRPPGNDVVIYGPETISGTTGRDLQGMCRIRIRSETDPHVTDPGQLQTGPRLYELSTPWDSPMANRGDLVRCVSSLRDIELVDAVFRVADVLKTSMLVHRKYILRDLRKL